MANENQRAGIDAEHYNAADFLNYRVVPVVFALSCVATFCGLVYDAIHGFASPSAYLGLSDFTRFSLLPLFGFGVGLYLRK